MMSVMVFLQSVVLTWRSLPVEWVSRHRPFPTISGDSHPQRVMTTHRTPALNGRVSEFRHGASEHLSRRQAAERLTDIAYALTIGPPFDLTVGDNRISVSITDELVLEGEMTSEGDRVRLELELSWSVE
jgi:amphi-Trp domain-containing protein